MTYQKRLVTIIALVLLFCISMLVLSGLKNMQIAKEAEFRSRYTLWQTRNPEAEAKIKGYIDDIDWEYYINQFSEALKNPKQSAGELYNRFGASE